MPHTVTFRKGQSAPAPVTFECSEGGDPYPVVTIRGQQMPVYDGDLISVSRSGKALGVRAGQVPDGELLEPYDWGPGGVPENKPFMWPEK